VVLNFNEEGILVNKKILVIEDDPSALRLIEHTLRQEGYQVLIATNGLDGLKKVKREEPDLIVLDILLPGVDGFEVCHRLRADPRTSQLPILVLSAKAREEDKTTGLKVGADDYMTKPAAPSEIVSRVGSLLAKKTAAKSEMVAFVGSKRGVGTTTLVVNIAIALSQKGKRVIVVDLCTDGANIADYLGLKPGRTITELLMRPVDTIDRSALEAALAVHHTGLRALTIPQTCGEQEGFSPADVDLLVDRLRQVTDYLLVDLPFQPSNAALAILSKCNFVAIVTDSKVGALSSVKSIATVLELLGISQQRMGAVVIDREGMFPEWQLSKMKSTIELSAGVRLLGVIPYDTKTSLELVPGGTSVLLSNPDCPMAWAMRGMAQHIIGEKTNNSGA